jgi:cell division transport system permease protein
MIDFAMAMSLRDRKSPMSPRALASLVGARGDVRLIPTNSISGRSLIAVVAIMAFLAALTTGTVMLVQSAASEWQSDVAREVTIQIRPGPGRDIEDEVRKATELARSVPGVIDARPYSRDESSKLLEPWLGTGLRLEDLPIPRLIVLRVAAGNGPDLVRLRQLMEQQVKGASLDDHRGWIEHMRTMAETAVAGGVLLLMLVFAATILSVSFATRGAMATNRPIIEVLHFVGAKDRFIARHFQRHFLILGIKGGIIGVGAALLLFGLAQLLSGWFVSTPAGEEVAALFGTFSIGWTGYAAVLAQVVLVAAVTTFTSRRTVDKTLETIE